MAKQPWKVEITVESDEALGIVLRKLHEMPGITDILPSIGGVGGAGAGAKRLEELASASRDQASGPGLREAILRHLMQATTAVHVDAIVAATGRLKSTVQSVLYKLKTEGILKSGGRGLFEIAVRPAEGQVVPQPIALPAPTHNTPTGRMSPGGGPALLLVILHRHAAPMPSAILRQQLQLQGVGLKSISGVVQRGIRDKLIKSNGRFNKTTYELTSKGQQQAATVTQHG